MHGLIFETSIWLLAGSTRFLTSRTTSSLDEVGPVPWDTRSVTGFKKGSSPVNRGDLNRPQTRQILTSHRYGWEQRGRQPKPTFKHDANHLPQRSYRAEGYTDAELQNTFVRTYEHKLQVTVGLPLWISPQYHPYPVRRLIEAILGLTLGWYSHLKNLTMQLPTTTAGISNWQRLTDAPIMIRIPNHSLPALHRVAKKRAVWPAWPSLSEPAGIWTKNESGCQKVAPRKNSLKNKVKMRARKVGKLIE